MEIRNSNTANKVKLTTTYNISYTDQFWNTDTLHVYNRELAIVA